MKSNTLFWGQPARLSMPMKNRTLSPAEETAIPYSDRELFQRTLRNLPRIAKPTRDVPLWVLVKELFACGEDVAHRICWRYGFDPDKTCRKSSYGPNLFWEDQDDGK